MPFMPRDEVSYSNLLGVSAKSGADSDSHTFPTPVSRNAYKSVPVPSSAVTASTSDDLPHRVQVDRFVVPRRFSSGSNSSGLSSTCPPSELKTNSAPLGRGRDGLLVQAARQLEAVRTRLPWLTGD